LKHEEIEDEEEEARRKTKIYRIKICKHALLLTKELTMLTNAAS